VDQGTYRKGAIEYVPFTGCISFNCDNRLVANQAFNRPRKRRFSFKSTFYPRPVSLTLRVDAGDRRRSVFNKKPYSQVNREESFYCSLFGHALLSSPSFRVSFGELVSERYGTDLHPDQLEIYWEVAALRDYWYDLGDPRRYTKKTHDARRKVVNHLLERSGVSANKIDEQKLFWTQGLGSKLRFPGAWPLKELSAANLDTLKEIRWAFNAKPDMLLLSPTGALIIEAKVESGVGRNGITGYDQLNTQELIACLWKELIPHFEKGKICLATLALSARNAKCISWKEILALLPQDEIDSFSVCALNRLGSYS